jgi:CheY-like chemotaxis protein
MLIIDVDEFNKMLIRKMIPEIGVIQQVANENDLAVLLEKEADSKPGWDVILLDNDFEQLNNGINLMKKYMDQFPYIKDIPFISMLSVPDKTTERKCLSVGFSGCIDKPITKENLIALLNKTLPGN